MTDEALLEIWATARDPAAFSELARRHGGLVYSTCHRILGDHHLAEDIAQECLFELASKAASVRNSVAGFLHSTAISRAHDRLRADMARERRESTAGAERAAASPSSEPNWAGVAPMIDAALAELPDEERLPLVLHFLENRSQAEVAQELGWSQPTVSRRITRGLATLRERLCPAGVALSVMALSSLLQANAVEAAPPALMASTAKMALLKVHAGASAQVAAVSTWSLAKVAAIITVLSTIGAASFAAAWIMATSPERQRHDRDAIRPQESLSQPIRAATAAAPKAAAERVVVWSRDFATAVADDNHGGQYLGDGTLRSVPPPPSMLQDNWRPDQLLWLSRSWVDGHLPTLFVVPPEMRVHLHLRAERVGHVSLSITYATQLVKDEGPAVESIAVGPEWQDVELPASIFVPSIGGRSFAPGLAIGAIGIWGFDVGQVALGKVDITGAAPSP